MKILATILLLAMASPSFAYESDELRSDFVEYIKAYQAHVEREGSALRAAEEEAEELQDSNEIGIEANERARAWAEAQSRTTGEVRSLANDIIIVAQGSRERDDNLLSSAGQFLTDPLGATISLAAAGASLFGINERRKRKRTERGDVLPDTGSHPRSPRPSGSIDYAAGLAESLQKEEAEKKVRDKLLPVIEELGPILAQRMAGLSPPPNGKHNS